MANSVLEIVREHAQSFEPVEPPIAESHGEEAISELIGTLHDWQLARVALEELARYPQEVKHRAVYGPVIDEAVKYFCREEGPSDCGYEVENIVDFMVRELAHHPDLAGELFEAIGDEEVALRGFHFLNLVKAARDPRAIRHLARLNDEYHWGEALVAVRAVDLGDLILDTLSERQDYSDTDLSLAAGFLLGETARERLLSLYNGKGYSKDGYALGLSFIAHPDDALLFKKLSTSGEGGDAKRIYKVLTSSKRKERVSTLPKLGTRNALGGRLLFCRLLSDADPHVVACCTACLRAYVDEMGEHQDSTYHAAFLAHAPDAAAAEVDRKTLQDLEQVQRSIPRAAPLFDKARLDRAPKDLEQKKTKKAAKVPEPSAAQRESEEAILDAIRQDPDRPDSYLVLADLLQARGDPRGELIVLQHAAGDKKTRKPAQLIEEHARHLLGELEKVPREEATLEWQLGFIRSARLRLTGKRLVKVLKTLLESPSALFLQELFVEKPKGRQTLKPDQVVQVLQGFKGPQTLRTLHLGEPGSFTPPDDLVAAFPRLARESGTDAWAEVVERLGAAVKRLKPDFNTRGLPKLERRPDAPPDATWPTTEQLLLGLKAELGKGRTLGLAEAMPQVYTSESLDQFARALAKRWANKGERTAQRYAFDAMGYLGADACVDFIGPQLAEWSHQRSVQGVGLLERIESPAAIAEIYRLALFVSRYHPRRDEARDALKRIADRRQLSVEQLLDRSCPREAEDQAATARLRQTQRHRLEDVLLSGHRISQEDFLGHYVDHPMRGAIVNGLLYGAFENTKLLGLYRVKDGALVDRAGKATSLAKTSTLGIVHPVEVSDEAELAAWRELFAKEKIEQPFPQLARPVHQLTEAERKADKLTRFAKRRVGYYAIEEALFARDWYVWDQNDGGGTESFARHFSRGNLTVVATLGSTGGSVAEVHVSAGGRWGSRRPLGQLDAVVASELLWDLESAVPARQQQGHASAGVSPPPSQGPTSDVEVLPQTGKYPMVERAKSGRSRCVVCEEKIEKDSLRIGVERVIETERFSGRGTAWLHPDCRAQCPELQGTKNLDDRLKRNSGGLWPPG